MLCSVIPYTRSIDDRLVTYELPEKFRSFVHIGSSVTVPWGKDTIIGIVADINTDIPYEGELKSVIAPHTTTPWLAPNEIALILHLARTLFVRIHIIAQVFIPVGLFGMFEAHNFIDLTVPSHPIGVGTSDYTIAPDEGSIIDHLRHILSEQPGAVIVPEGLSVQWWHDRCELGGFLDPHPKSLARQKKVYLSLLSGSESILFGTRRTLTKRLGHYKHVYILHENLSRDIHFGLRKIPLWIMAEHLARHGHCVHYISTTPSIRTLTKFLQHKHPVTYLS